MPGTRRSKIRKDDQVVVISGSDRGRRGRVIEIVPAKGKVKIEGVAIVKRHTRQNQQGRPGGIIEKERFIDISNVQLIDPDSGKGTRVKYEVNADGSRSRVSTRSGQILDK